MTKKRIIIISVLIGVLALLLVLFGGVFCLRNQYVVWNDFESTERTANTLIENKDLIEVAGFKEGTSIFALNKEQATKNIENKFPYVKVIQIKTKSAISIEFDLRERYALYYTQFNFEYYVFDEDMKVLAIKDEVPTNLIKVDNKKLNITAKTAVCDFIGNEKTNVAMKNVYTALYSIPTDGDNTYFSRQEICYAITEIKLDTCRTLSGEYLKVILTTSNGVKIEIWKPEIDMNYKMNLCYNAISELTEEQRTTGTIIYFYNANDEAKCGYIG